MDNINNHGVYSNDQKISNIVYLGHCLRKARETMGLTQKSVAESLCLKLSIIKDIEEGYLEHLKISSTFLYGYIRSYARLVGIHSEEMMIAIFHELNPTLSVQSTSKFKIFYRAYYRYRIRLLIILCVIFFVFIVFISFSIIWNSKYFLFKKQYAHVLPLKSTNCFTSGYDKKNLTFFSEKNILNRNVNFFFNDGYYIDDTQYPLCSIFCFSEVFEKLLGGMQYYGLHKGIVFDILSDINIVNNIINVTDDDVLTMSFTADCWVEIFDGSGKRLHVGTEYSGNILHLKGETPYKLIIGAPQSVQIKYQGNIVNLTRFVHPYKVARITIPD